jgi:hypothetical protein
VKARDYCIFSELPLGIQLLFINTKIRQDRRGEKKAGNSGGKVTKEGCDIQ